MQIEEVCQKKAAETSGNISTEDAWKKYETRWYQKSAAPQT